MTGDGRSAYDTIVVGASFSGLVFARTAATLGLRVLVLERRWDAGDRVHSTGVLVREAAEAVDIPRRLTRKVAGVRVYGPSMRHADLTSEGEYFLATDTAGLLRWLAEQAESAGASIRYGHRFTGATRASGRLVLDDSGLVTRYLVGADGARSQVARHFGLGTNRRFLVGLEAEFPVRDALDPGFLHCLVDSVAFPGHIGWLVPGHDALQVGMACSYPRRPDLANVLDKVAHLWKPGAMTPTNWRAGLIPVNGPVRPFAAPGVLLIGDAAGLTSPLTGAGIANAFGSGRRAARLVSDHLEDGSPEPSVRLGREYPRHALSMLGRAVLSSALPNPILDRALDTEAARGIIRRVVFRRRLGFSPGATGTFKRDPLELVTEGGRSDPDTAGR